MELLLGAGIALLQILVLPGWLIVRSLGRHRDGPLQTALYAFGLSLLANHLLVVGLVAAGAYTRPVLWGIVTLECAAAAFLGHRERGAPRGAPAESAAQRLAGRLRREDGCRILFWGFVALATTGFLLARVPVSFGSAFEFWDAIVSWNRWAVDWEAGRLPAQIFQYPQLLPTTWSLAYVMTGHPLQFVARGVMAFFPLVVAGVLLDLWWKRDRIEWLVAVPAAVGLLAAALGAQLGSGMADPPVAAMTLLAFHPILARPLAGPGRETAARIATAALLGGAAALTKQAGLCVLLLLPALVFVCLGAPWRRRARAAAGAAALILATITPWYAYARWRIAQGRDLDESIVIPQMMFGDAPFSDRAARALDLWQAALTPPLLALVMLLLAASLLHRRGRWVTLCAVVPCTLYWALWFSYDLRNHAVALPFAGVSLAAGWEALRERLSAPARRRALALAGVAALAWLALWDPSPRILEAQQRQLVSRGKPALNQALLDYQAEHGLEGKILTNYRYLTSFPSLREHYFQNRRAGAADFWTFRGGLDAFRSVVEDPAQDVRYVLLQGFVDEDVDLYIAARVRSRDYALVLNAGGGRMYHILKR